MRRRPFVERLWNQNRCGGEGDHLHSRLMGLQAAKVWGLPRLDRVGRLHRAGARTSRQLSGRSLGAPRRVD